MATRKQQKELWMFTNGKWIRKVPQGQSTKNQQIQDWAAPKEKEDWACFKCDDSSAEYLGNYANEDQCRTCDEPKRLCHHMTMQVRNWHLEQGTLRRRAVRLEARELKKQRTETVTVEEDEIETCFSDLKT